MARFTFGVAAFQFEPMHIVLDIVREAERLGFSHVWAGDSQMITREAYVSLGAFAMATQRVKIGTSVTLPQTRHVTVLASAWSTLAELTGGRAVLGIGPGDSAVETIGLRPAKIADLAVTVDTIRRLVRGEDVEMNGSQVRLTHAWGQDIPLYVAASGPKMLDFTGRTADGAILLVGTDPVLVAPAIERLRAARQESSSPDRPIYVVLWVPFSIDRTDGDAARGYVRSHVARAVAHPQPLPLPPEDQQVIQRIRERYDYYLHLQQGSPQEEEVPRRLVEKFAIAGTPDDCLEQVRRLAESGLPIDQVALVPHGPDRAAQLRLFTDQVLGRL